MLGGWEVGRMEGREDGRTGGREAPEVGWWGYDRQQDAPNRSPTAITKAWQLPLGRLLRFASPERRSYWGRAIRHAHQKPAGSSARAHCTHSGPSVEEPTSSLHPVFVSSAVVAAAVSVPRLSTGTVGRGGAGWRLGPWSGRLRRTSRRESLGPQHCLRFGGWHNRRSRRGDHQRLRTDVLEGGLTGERGVGDATVLFVGAMASRLSTGAGRVGPAGDSWPPPQWTAHPERQTGTGPLPPLGVGRRRAPATIQASETCWKRGGLSSSKPRRRCPAGTRAESRSCPPPAGRHHETRAHKAVHKDGPRSGYSCASKKIPSEASPSSPALEQTMDVNHTQG